MLVAGRPTMLIAVLGMACFQAVAAGCGADDKEKPPAELKGCAAQGTPFTIWVTNQAVGFDTVTVLENHGDEKIEAKILATIPVGRAPHNIAFSADGRFAFVANLGTPPESGSVSVIDTRSYTVVATATAGIKAHGARLTPDDAWLWVANTGGNDVTVLDTTPLRTDATKFGAGERPAPIRVGQGPALVLFLPDGKKAYVSNGTDGTTSVVDVTSRKVQKTIATGKGAMGLVLSSDGKLVFETEGLDDRISVIDTASDTVVNVLTFEKTLKEPHGIARAGDELLLITNRTANSLSFVHARTLEKIVSIAVPGRPDIIAVEPSCHKSYMTLRDVPAVAVVDVVDRRYLDIISLKGGELHGLAILSSAPAK